MNLFVLSLAAAALAVLSSSDDRATVAALDDQYQAAVKANDAATMDKILLDDFILVIGNGTVYNKADLLKAARDKSSIYEHQESTQQVVRMYGANTAVVTARLWIKGTGNGQAFDFKVWYSDTYVKTPGGWRYAFGQAGAHLP